MPDLLEDLNEFRPTNTSDLLPVGAADHVARAVIHDCHLRWTRIGALGTAAVLLLTIGFVRLTSLPSTVAGPAGQPAAGSGSPFMTPEPTVGTAKVVTTKQTVKGSVAAAPLTARRVGTGTLFEPLGGSLKLCARAVTPDSMSGSTTDRTGVGTSGCVAIPVAGVTLDQISWAQTNMTGIQAEVDFIGTLDSPDTNPTFTIDTVAPAGTLTISSDRNVPQNYPAMTCLRSSDPGTGGQPKDVGTVTGYQGTWTQGGTVYVAATGDAPTVEAQVRTAGYGGPLCVGRLATPTADEILLPISTSTLPGIGLMTSSQVLMNGGPHVEVTVLANVPGGQQILTNAVTAVAPGVGVDVNPALLTVS